MTDNELIILNYIKDRCRGKQSAETFGRLSLLLGIEPRHLRLIVSDLIKSGRACICSTSQDGYYWPETEEEFNHAQAEDISRIDELRQKKDGRQQAWDEYKLLEQNIKYEQPVML